MAKANKKTKKKAVSKKTTTKKAVKKKATKKVAKKKVTKKTTKKKATIKAVKKKNSKKTIKKKAAKKTAKKKASPKKATKKKTSKKKVSSAVGLKVYSPRVTVGAKVPDFSVSQTGDETFSLEKYKGKKLVLFFYPKDATPGCTIEGHDFTRLHKDFSEAGTEVFGISRDSIKSHEKFKNNENYSIELLSDPDEKLCAIFGVIKLKNMYGKQVRGIDRSTFLINEDGALVKEWRGVKVPGHADEVLETVKSL